MLNSSPGVSWRKARWISAIAIAAQIVAWCGCGGSSGGVAGSSSEDADANRQASSGPDDPRLAGGDGDAGIRFTDLTKESQVDVTYRNGSEAKNFSILESLGGGVGTIDYDNDGWLDLVFPGGGGYEGPPGDKSQRIFGWPTRFFRNLGDWRFGEVSVPAGDGFPAEKYTHGVAAADYDNDGFVDFLVTGYGGLQFWRNNGDGTFSESHEAAGLLDDLWSSAAGFGDVNGDGLIDLYVAHYVDWSFANHPFCTGTAADIRDICPPKVFEPLPDKLFLNAGDGQFRDVTAEARLRTDGKGLGVALADIDGDGDLDIYVANDTTENFLYINDGAGVFEEIGALSGVAVDDRGTPNGSMGVDIGDFNRDGKADIWVANFEVESFALYRNEGGNQFLHVSQATGVTALNGLFVGFGTAFADLNGDGYEDLVVTNGHVIKYPRMAPLRQQPLVLLSEKGRHFRRLPMKASPYFKATHGGRGLATGDLDNDGDLDLVFANNEEPAALLRNDSVANGKNSDAEKIHVRLVGVRTNRDGIGAVVTLKSDEGEQSRYWKGGTSYLSRSSLTADFFIPRGDTPQSITVQWPNGGSTQSIDPMARSSITVVEAEGGAG